MHAARSEKSTIREIWIDVLKRYDRQHSGSTGLLYVMLPGAEGREIDLLVEHNLIELTEIGSIAQESMTRIAAVESSPLAVGVLQRKFPGLKIYQTNFAALVRGHGLLSYPQGDERNCCRARVINLDLNETLAVRDDGSAAFPILIWIQKLGEMHAAYPRLDWCLYLTLHGEVHWTKQLSETVRIYLQENFGRAELFSRYARTLLGAELHEQIFSGAGELDVAALPREQQQKILMAFVPKKIADLVRTQHWRLETESNLRYGQPGHAPMVTWIIHFKHDLRAAGIPDAVYVESLNGVLAVAGRIELDGSVIQDGEEES
jgi:hypothetical protein